MDTPHVSHTVAEIAADEQGLQPQPHQPQSRESSIAPPTISPLTNPDAEAEVWTGSYISPATQDLAAVERQEKEKEKTRQRSKAKAKRRAEGVKPKKYRAKSGKFVSKRVKALERESLEGSSAKDTREAPTKAIPKTPVRSKKQVGLRSRSDEVEGFVDEDQDELGEGHGYTYTSRVKEKHQESWSANILKTKTHSSPLKRKRTITLSPTRGGKTITLKFERQSKRVRLGSFLYAEASRKGIFEDTEKDEKNEAEKIGGDSEAEVEPDTTDTTDELQKDYSQVEEKENQTRKEGDRKFSPLPYPRPRRFGLKDWEGQVGSGSLKKTKPRVTIHEQVRDKSESPPYQKPNQFQKKEKGRETLELLQVAAKTESKNQAYEKGINKRIVTDTPKVENKDIKTGHKRGFDDFHEPFQSGEQEASQQNSIEDDNNQAHLPEDTVCISKFLKPEILSTLMPSLEVAKKRRTSPTTSTPTATLVNGLRKTEKIKLAPHRSPVSHRKSLPPKDKDGEGRNIDSIIFGDITFKAWYPSWYPKEIIGEKEGKDREVVSELYVCKKCFGYGKDVLEWRKHVRVCRGGLEKEGLAREIYKSGGWEGKGTWSVWEVDGSVETLFCQNLSLFAKLFLDNKSVFFDVSGFNYFLLVHTSPSPPSDPSSPPERQIIGFFSKEKMSWDNNNLACILIFPPWQRKGLGALLIGVSYAIARREGIMGGPEKPISELGMKGYKRFWGAEIARWILDQEVKTKSKDKEEMDVDRISRETWISPEDCLAILREMGVVENIEEKGGKSLRKEGEGTGSGSVNGDKSGEKEKEKIVQRVKIDKAKVREWVERNKLSLERVVSEEGFLEGYALPGVEEGMDDEEEVVEEE